MSKENPYAVSVKKRLAEKKKKNPKAYRNTKEQPKSGSKKK